MLLLGGALLAVAWILQQIIDIASGDSVAPLVRMCWLCLGVLVSVTTIYVVQCYTYPAFLRRAMKQYKEYAFTELTKKSISTFSDENTSRYISALTNDAVCIETNYLAKIFTLLTKSVSFVGGLVMMLLYSPLLTGFALLLSLVPLAVSVLCGNRLARMETEVSRQNESFVAMTKDLLSGFSVVKSFKAEAEVVARFCRRNEELEETKGRRRRMEEVITMLGTGAGIVAQLGVFLFGAYLAVTKQGVTPGVVIVFLPLMSFVVDPIGSVPPILANRRAAVALIDKLADAVGKNVRESGEQMDPVLRDGITIDQYPAELPENYKTLQEQGFKDCYMLVYHYLMGPAGMDETMVKQMNAAMEEVVNDPTVHDGIAGIGHIPGWHDLEESEELHQKEYDELVNIAKNLGTFRANPKFCHRLHFLSAQKSFSEKCRSS